MKRLRKKLYGQLHYAGYDVVADHFPDGSDRWINIVKADKSNQTSISISFDVEERSITEIQIFTTPIIVKVDSDNTKRIF